MNAELPHTMRELHSRTNDGIHFSYAAWHGIDASSSYGTVA